ncbi:lauroyl acyltransferase [Rhodovulum sp. 12E13]|uniref:lysophospholipid acyltransferase family protein n=1 Tax=Rhodovulum sp. 12E13 TaxID=2203891 RepID=UPI000E14BAD6|nr:lysophospholipid acyltransferase family protein [Rhodovulum sp. 12E13]RDC71640.1 lauroyl acyltransferase [Rhodovulum sp. 12E13]
MANQTGAASGAQTSDENEGGRVDAADQAADLALRALVGVARTLPYDARIRFGGAVFARAVAPLTRMGARIDENLSYIYPDLSAAARRQRARAAARQAGRLLMENYSSTELARRMARVVPTGPGLPALAAARDEGRPVLLLTGHFGNYEAARACLVAQGYVIGGLYRPMANALVNRHYVATMQAIGGPIFPQGRAGTKGLIAHLKRGGMAMMLNDLYTGTGVALPFLGRPAMTSPHPAEIALRTGAEVVCVFGTRRADGLSFDVEVEAPLPRTDALEMTRAYNDAVSARIRAHPEQWFWMHRRWKRKWNRGEGMEPGLHPAELPSRRSRL